MLRSQNSKYKKRLIIILGTVLVVVVVVIGYREAILKYSAPPILRAIYPYFRIKTLPGNYHYSFGNHESFEYDFYAKEIKIGNTPFFLVVENKPKERSIYQFFSIGLHPEPVIVIKSAQKVQNSTEAFETNIFQKDISGDGVSEALIRTKNEKGFSSYQILREVGGLLVPIKFINNEDNWSDIDFVEYKEGIITMSRKEKDYLSNHNYILIDDTLISENQLEQQEKEKNFKEDLSLAASDPRWAPLAAQYKEECYPYEMTGIPDELPFRSFVQAIKPEKIMPDGTKVLILFCMAHAYQYSYMVVLDDGKTYTPLLVEEINREGESIFNYRVVEMFYDSVKDVFVSATKGRGLGDCWTTGVYKLIDRQLILQKYTAKWECDGNYEGGELIYSQAWPTYESKNLGIKFSYPSTAISITESDKLIELKHSISLIVPRYCGEGPGPVIPLGELTDFYLSIEYLDTGLREAIKTMEKDALIDEEKFKSQAGVTFYSGVEGCGQETVFIPINNSKTLKIEKLFDDSNYFLISMPDEKKAEIKGLLYQNTLERWQDTDKVINSIEILPNTPN
ncbi:MAG: DUF1176 domain-containing protein [Patescibacteria group bacterium]